MATYRFQSLDPIDAAVTVTRRTGSQFGRKFEFTQKEIMHPPALSIRYEIRDPTNGTLIKQFDSLRELQADNELLFNDADHWQFKPNFNFGNAPEAFFKKDSQTDPVSNNTGRVSGRFGDLRRGAGTSRSEGAIRSIRDLQKYFREKRILVLGKDWKIPVEIPISQNLDPDGGDKNFFFVELKYQKEGERQRIFKILEQDGQSIVISRRSLYVNPLDPNSDEPFNPENKSALLVDPALVNRHILYYRQVMLEGGSFQDIRVTDFEPVFIDELNPSVLAKLKFDLQNIKNEFTVEESEQAKLRMFAFLRQKRGFTDAGNAVQWLKQQGLIESNV